LCLFCNIKRPKTIAKLSENNWNKRRSKCFQRRHLWRQHLYCYHFFLSLYMNKVPEMLYLVHDLITLKFIWLFWPLLLGLCLNITQLEDKFRLRHDCFYISLLIIQRPTYTVSAQRSMIIKIQICIPRKTTDLCLSNWVITSYQCSLLCHINLVNIFRSFDCKYKMHTKFDLSFYKWRPDIKRPKCKKSLKIPKGGNQNP
jgi:hypothetical protein